MRTRRQPEGMRELRKATAAAERAEGKRDEEIYRAFNAGNSLRAIAVEAGMSHEAVRAIVLRVGAWARSEEKILTQTKTHYSTTDAGRAAAERKWLGRRKHLDWVTFVKDSDE